MVARDTAHYSSNLLRIKESSTNVVKEAFCLNTSISVVKCSRSTFASCRDKMNFSFKKMVPPVGQLIKINLRD